MDNLPTPNPENGGWYLAAALAVAGVFKAAVQRIQRRDALDAKRAADGQEHAQGLQLKALAAEESATARLVTMLEGRVAALERRVDEQDEALKLAVKREGEDAKRIALLESDVARLRGQRDRAINAAQRAAEIAQRAPRASALEASRLAAEAAALADEVSAADDAPSLPGAGR